MRSITRFSISFKIVCSCIFSMPQGADLYILLVCIFAAEHSGSSESYGSYTVVRTHGQTIRGLLLQNKDELVEAYLGVPYGKPPIRSLRFTAPKPADPWKGELNATSLAKSCYQDLDTTSGNFTGSQMWNEPLEETEDCLNMNIWVPRNNSKFDGTVMVWIFGGAYQSGSPSMDVYNGQTLAAKTGVIVVNINYRLGPFGFLYLGKNSAVTGNQGLLDQQTALTWIQDNIHAFGGSPHKVTIFGESAGASSVDFHLMAPDSQAKFKNSIMESGSLTNSWAMEPPEVMLSRSRLLAEKLNCAQKFENTEKMIACVQGLAPDPANCPKVDHPNNVLKCLQEKTTKEILQAAASIWYEHIPIQSYPFVPIPEDGKFFKENVFASISKGNVKQAPVLLGTNKDEGTYLLPYYDLSDKLDPEFFFNEQHSYISENEYKTSIRETLKAHYPKTFVQPLLDKVAKLYAKPQIQDYTYRNGIAKFYDDLFYTCAVLKRAEELTKADIPVYAYYFTERSSTNPWPEWMGVMHGYEIEYVFGSPVKHPKSYSEAEVDFSKKIMRLWTDFARNGKPANDTSQWPQYGSMKTYRILSSKKETSVQNPVQQNLRSDRCALWTRVNRCDRTLKENASTISARLCLDSSGVPHTLSKLMPLIPWFAVLLNQFLL